MASFLSRGWLRAGLSLASALAVSAATADVFSDYNLFVGGSLDSTTEVAGRTFVTGNLTGPSSTYAFDLTPASAYLNTDTLLVGGSINVSNINLQAGNLRLGGTRTGNVNFNGGGHQIADGGLAAIGAANLGSLSATSTFLAALSTNSSVNIPSGQPGPVDFIASPSGPDNVAVFNVPASLFSNSLVQQYNLTTNGASSIIINVIGSTVNLNQGNFTGNWNLGSVRATTLWNFVDATSIALDRQFDGAILAPLASLSNSGPIEGSVFIGGSFTQRGEVHLPSYTGYIPEPATLSLLTLAGLASLRRRSA